MGMGFSGILLGRDGKPISAGALAAGYRTAFGYREDGSSVFAIDRNRILTKPQAVIDFLNTPVMRRMVQPHIRRKRNSGQPLDRITFYDFKNWRDSGNLPIMLPGEATMRVKTGTLIDWFEDLARGHDPLNRLDERQAAHLRQRQDRYREWTKRRR